MEYTAENYIEFIESGRTDKISSYGLQRIAEEFRRLQKQVNSRSKTDAKAVDFVDNCARLAEYVNGKYVNSKYKHLTIPVVEYNELRDAAIRYDSEHI